MVDREVLEKQFEFPAALEDDNKDVREELAKKAALNRYSILADEDPMREAVQQKLSTGEFDSVQEDRALGCMLGMAVGDALGAPLEFSAVRYGSTEVKSMEQEELWTAPGYNRFSLKPGQWTDDCSMGLCLADSFLTNKGTLNPHDLRLRFLNWWTLGYNNAFGYDDDPCFKGQRRSVGLGGSISASLSEFIAMRTNFTTAGDRQTSGNGSLMRLAPVPVLYHDRLNIGMRVAYEQSKTTHQGDEAAELCSLATMVMIEAINNKSDAPHSVFEGLGDRFKTDVYSVARLAAAKVERRHPQNKGLKLDDRRWDWKQPNYRYCKSRASLMPGYVGSYAMDNLSMAFHCVYSTTSFEEALLKVVNMRGDADSVGSVVGQLAGAMYGASSIPKPWIERVQRWDRGGDIAVRAQRLFLKDFVTRT